MTSKRAYKQDILIFSQKVSSFPKEFVAHSAAVNCLKIGRKSSRVLVIGGEDHKVNLWAICKPNAILELLARTIGLAREKNLTRRYSLSTTQNTVATLQLAHIKIFCQQEPLIQPKVVRCCLQYASAIAKASLMSKCVVVDIKEPDSAASAAFRARDGGQKDLHDFQCVMINRF
ncbi:unnamed protein product [Brassica napus]|uniref:(rape) hypothetical protein n=1 Tax=Brassica napus TaxID=3708 RepID=A0A816W188_BRANA|nr:unnamed protein product [Brassica napus]